MFVFFEENDMRAVKYFMLLSVLLISASITSAWWNSSFEYRTPINVTEESGQDLQNYQIELSVNTESIIENDKMENDCSDMRFANSSDNELDYWIQEGCNTTSTTVWVQMNNIQASEKEKIFMYHGNSEASENSDPKAVWQKYVNFSDGVQSAYGSQDADPSSYKVLDNGRTLRMWDNTWKRVDYDFTSDSMTALMYSFKSENNEPEINGVGFDSNDQIDGNGWDIGERHWVIYGYQNWGEYINDYSGGWENRTFRPDDYSIAGETYSNIVFDNDNDDNVNTDAYYKDVRVGKQASTRPSTTIGSEEKQSFCDRRGPIKECIVDTDKDIAGGNRSFQNIFISEAGSSFTSFGSQAKISIFNKTYLSGVWKGDFNITSRDTVIQSGAKFKPSNRIIIGEANIS